MSDNSAIEWTDATWNPVRGCTKVSPGCANCYAETFAERWRGVKGHAYEQGFDLRLVPDKVDEPLRWRAGVKESCPDCMGSGSKNDAVGCGACGSRGWTTRPKRIFVNSMSDLFQDGVPDQFITDVFGIMVLAHWHTFQLLTKRAERMRDYMAAGDHGIIDQMQRMMTSGGISTKPVFAALDAKRRDAVQLTWPPPNVFLGVSVENQHFANERIPLLLKTPAAVRFISAEPLLEAIDIRFFMRPPGPPDPPFVGPAWAPVRVTKKPWLDWVIVGGESGHGARPFNVAWARSVVQQCKAAGVPVFMKQLGADPVYQPEMVPASRGPFGLGLRHKKGGDMSEWPEDLCVREFPRQATT